MTRQMTRRAMLTATAAAAMTLAAPAAALADDDAEGAGLSYFEEHDAMERDCASALADESQDPEMILGLFWNSENNLSDTLYVSCNGIEYHKISVPFPCADGGDDTVLGTYDIWGNPVNYVHALHDPGLFYKDGNFWAVGGYVQYQDGLGWRFTPMFASSKDLEHWSFPNSGSATNLAPKTTPAGTYAGGQYDSCGTEAFADDNGTVWLVTTLGYFGMFHGQDYNDTMTPYICRIDGLAPGADQTIDPGAQPKLSYGALTSINLPTSGTNWLDPSLYKENGTYYLSIKKDGITNMIYSIKDLKQAGSKDAWRLVCADVVTGYEGPSLTKANGTYLMVTDKLKDYPYGSSDGTTGNFVTMSTSLSGGWHSTQRIATMGISNGKTYSIPNRHGSVLKVPAEATELVKTLHRKAGWSDFSSGVTMHRLYNKYTGEHFYTADASEKDGLVNVGWTYEGVGWTAPSSSATPVYRLYNSYVPGGDHHYTTSKKERDDCVKAGWTDEGVGWCSDDAKGTPLYRQYNPYATTGTHNYTTSKAENDYLVSVGWSAEGVAWYGVK
ncbi:hypothetical protein [Paratractidigestivibacter sp.]|uniref:hypothetical protein n=1 Tax=Paratractidigestivibacter sp. TaxID=2847316 RepID=UPI002ABE8FA2|nr:hypothetical protein [Paratractidigestivibacter sp.]